MACSSYQRSHELLQTPKHLTHWLGQWTWRFCFPVGNVPWILLNPSGPSLKDVFHLLPWAEKYNVPLHRLYCCIAIIPKLQRLNLTGRWEYQQVSSHSWQSHLDAIVWGKDRKEEESSYPISWFCIDVVRCRRVLLFHSLSNDLSKKNNEILPYLIVAVCVIKNIIIIIMNP